jgi:hypothetical protein
MISVQKLLFTTLLITAWVNSSAVLAEYRSFDSQNHREEVYKALNSIADSFEKKLGEQKSLQVKGIEVASIQPVLLTSLSSKEPEVRFDVTYKGRRGEAGESIECSMQRNMKLRYSNNFEDKLSHKSLTLILSNCITRTRFSDEKDFFENEHSSLLEGLKADWESDAVYAQSVIQAIQRGVASDENMDEIIQSYSAPERAEALEEPKEQRKLKK